MRIRHPGKVCDRLWYLGREESGVYLLEGRDGFLMLNGGMSYIVPDLLPQFEEFGIDEGRITKLSDSSLSFRSRGDRPLPQTPSSHHGGLCVREGLGDFT